MSEKQHRFILNLIDNRGLFEALRILNLTFTELFSLGVGTEYFDRKIKQEFIQDYLKYLGYGIGLSEIDVEPIMYSNNEKELREIVYISASKVSVEVWDWETESVEGEFDVSYHNLNDNFIDIIFDIVIELHDNNFDL